MFDPATLAVFLGVAILLFVAALLKSSSLHHTAQLLTFLSIAAFEWIALTLLGEFVTGWATNTVCYAYLGCNDGFFGYDAIEHLFFGFALVLLMLWLNNRHGSYPFKAQTRTHTILTLIAYVALVAVAWELLECGWDQYRIVILRETLFNFRLHIDALSQSSNLDTMGDISFTILGALLASMFAEFLQPGILKRTEH